MSKWREVGPEKLSSSDSTVPLTVPSSSDPSERLVERLVEPLTKLLTEPLTEPLKTQLSEEIKEIINRTAIEPQTQSERLTKRLDEPITEPITKPLTEPLKSEFLLEGKSSKEAYVALDATHTASEAKIYGFLYRLSISRGQPTCRASLADIHKALGLSKVTIIKALRGLSEKLSIVVLDSRAGSKIGSLYHVYNVKEILARRKEAGIELDDYKRVVPKGTAKGIVKGTTKRLVNGSETVPLNVQKLNVQLNVQPPTNSLTEDALTGPVRKTKNIILRNDDDAIASSSMGDDDVSSVDAIKRIYCDLTGNEWRQADDAEVETIKQIPLGHVVLGICYSIDRAAGHQVNSLKYCIPSIMDHYEAMSSFPEKALMEIAYTHMLRIKNARKANRWDT
jgi:hypothetical protein